MVGHKEKNLVIFPAADINGDRLEHGLDPTPNTRVSLRRVARPVKMAELTLSSVAITMSAANDFGSHKLLDLPASNVMFLGVMLDLTVDGMAGFAVNQADALDLAIGSVTTASTTFANAGEDDMMEKIDGVGAAATGTAKGHSASDGGLGPVLFTANSDVWLNASSAVTSGTGTATVSGTVTVLYLDLEEHA